MNDIFLRIESHILCIIFLWILLAYNIKFEHSGKKSIRGIYILTIISSVADIFRLLLSKHSVFLPIAHVANIFYFCSFGFIGCLWTSYYTDKFNIFQKNRAFKILNILPASVVAVCSIVSVKTGWIYTIDNSGTHSHGELYSLIFLSFAYAVATWIFSLVIIKKSSSRQRRNCIIHTLLTLPVVIAGVLDTTILSGGLSLTPYSVFVSMLILFIDSQYNRILIDNLTKLPNRYGMDNTIYEQLEEYRKNKNDTFFVIVCDLDNFKHINDTWGHLEGDRALKLISGVLDRVVEQYDSSAFRFGGDEFVIIVDTSDSKLPEEICSKLKCELSGIDFRDDFDIRMSMGIAMYDGKSTVAEMINSADKQLYEVKRKNNQN